MAHIFMRQTCLFYLGIGVPVFPGDDHVIAQKQEIVKFRWSPGHSQNQMFAGMSTKKSNLNEQIRLSMEITMFSSFPSIYWHWGVNHVMVSRIRESIHTGESRFKKPYFSFLQLRVVWFKKDLCIESKNRSSKKMSYVGKFISCDLS